MMLVILSFIYVTKILTIFCSSNPYSYCGYGRDQKDLNLSAKEESLMAFFSIMQCILLGSFAAILGAHRSEILDKPRPESPYGYEPPVTGQA